MVTFCSRETQQFNEPIGGSAMQIKRYIFISWPRGEWSFSPMVPQNAPDEFEEFMNELRKSRAASVRLYNCNSRNSDTVDIILCPKMVQYKGVPKEELVDCLKGILADENPSYPQHQLPGKHLFICTHGIRDRCCAKFGYGTVRALKSELASANATRSEFTIWETSHLIGDRFAGTGIQFPEGHMYGRINGENACDLLHSIDEDIVYSPCYRGNVFMDEQRQTCEAFAREFMFKHRLWGEVSVEELANDEFEIGIRTMDAHYRVKLTLIQREFPFYSNCTQLDQKKVSSKLRWCFDTVEFEPGS